jgi:hypothetical protein
LGPSRKVNGRASHVKGFVAATAIHDCASARRFRQAICKPECFAANVMATVDQESQPVETGLH